MKKNIIVGILLMISFIFLSGCVSRTPTEIVLGNTYSNFGFSMGYSNDLIIEEQGFAYTEADSDSGILFGDVEYTDTDTYHIIKISWFNVGPIEDSEEVRTQNLYDSLENGFLLVENDEVEIRKGDIEESTLDGYTMYYQDYEYESGEVILYGVLGTIYCDENGRYYTINIGYSEENAYSVFEKYVNSFNPSI